VAAQHSKNEKRKGMIKEVDAGETRQKVEQKCHYCESRIELSIVTLRLKEKQVTTSGRVSDTLVHLVLQSAYASSSSAAVVVLDRFTFRATSSCSGSC